jgi:hypothetical protein
MENTNQQLFEEFSSVTTTTIIKKNWELTYKGKEVTGTYSYEDDAWGFHERNVEIDDESDLTEEEIDEIIDYVIDVI